MAVENNELKVIMLGACFLQIHKLIIGHDGKGFAAGWYLDEVSVDVPSRNEHVVFPCKRWLDSSEGDKKIERELYPGINHF